MSYPVGQKLAQARIKRGLSIEEAAHETKMRPDKIYAIENDDYSSFPSNAYAKGFIKNYARYLNVDVGDFLCTFDSSMPIGVADYEYLKHEPEPVSDSTPLYRERRKPSFLPIATTVALAVIALMGFWINENARRIFTDSDTAPKTSAAATPAPVPVLPVVPEDIAAPTTLSLDPVPATSEARPPSPNRADDRAVLDGTLGGNPLDHDRVTPLPVIESPETIAARSGPNEVLVASVKNAHVVVRRDDAGAPPIFQGIIYPGIQPLKLRGTRFFIESSDPDSVQITKNGLPIAFEAKSVAIQ